MAHLLRRLVRPFRRLLPLAALAAAAPGLAQPSSTSPLAPPANGPRSAEPDRWAIVGATVHAAPGRTLEDAVIFIEDGTITRVGPAGDLTGWRQYDATGLHAYAGFIDAGVEVAAPAEPSDAPGRHWSPLVTPRRSVLDGAGLPESEAKRLRELGFAAAAIRPAKGIFRGTGAVVSTAKAPEDASRGTPPVHAAGVFQAIGFDQGSGVRGYPTSVMGAVSVMRQTLSDAHWQSDAPPSAPNALSPLEDPRTPLLFECPHELGILLSDGVAEEFAREAIILGSGMEFRRLEAVASTGLPVIVPLRFPAKPDVASVGAADAIELSTLMEWEQAPTNPRRLAEAGLTVAITSANLPKGAKFYDNLRRAIDEGSLTEDAALAMLTTNPAEILGLGERLGTIEPGKAANVLLTDKPAFEPKAQRRALFIDGRPHRLERGDDHGLDGDWRLWVGPEDAPFFSMDFAIKGKAVTITHEAEPGGAAEAAEADAPAEGGDPAETAKPSKHKARDAKLSPRAVSFLVDSPEGEDAEGTYILSGVVTGEGRLRGSGIAPDQSAFAWSARRTGEPEEKDEDKKPAKAPEKAPEDFGGYPLGEYAVKEIPPQGAYLLTGATIWTSGPEGVIDKGWVQIVNGTIRGIGRGDAVRVLSPERATTIDCTGLHITPGLIDCHSHTGLFGFGVNEAGQAVTAECRIHDSLDPGDVNFYRQLAGGLTTVNSLHGSANPIGGQNAVHKIRWGARHPGDMLLEGAKPGIKFALGENVKQSNWGTEYNSRYPQTRMGVETLIRERFTAAREYAERAPIGKEIEQLQAMIAETFQSSAPYADSMKATREKSGARISELTKRTGGMPPRRDLELETLAQILAGERLVHCHSYRQDEILMLCRIAEDFGFKIGTFQHGLEVYKVAEAVREHAIGASIFSDWWAFKVEVQDAIPYAGPLQHEAGVNTSFNSDDNELARRMNLEAAKAVKYSGGRITPEEALKFVTINPAIQLAIDDRVGSIEVGKDADVVVWSGDPLSSYSRPLRVFVDGRESFNDEIDAAHRQRITAERRRLLQKIIAAPDRPEDKAKGEDDAPGAETGEVIDSPPSLLERLYLARRDEPHQQGVCGCWWLGGSMEGE